MQSLGRILVLGALACGLLLAPTVQAAAPFNLVSGPTYASVPTNTMEYQFNAVITDPVAGDQVHVTFNPIVPDGWFAQYCQTSTGICYFGSADLTIRTTHPDTLQVDFFPMQGDTKMGWVEMKVSRNSDPLTFADVTYVLGQGVTLPVPNFTFTDSPAFKQANPGDIVGFPGPIRSQDAINDSLIVTIEPTVPQDWFAQYCQQSTGICYFGRATIAFNAFALDTLLVDIFTGQTPDVGAVRMKAASRANPAIWRSVTVRARTGNIPAGIADGAAAGAFRVQVAPNPFRGATSLNVALGRTSPIHLLITDATGRTLVSRVTEPFGPGVHPISWNARDDAGRMLPSGTYFYRVDGAGQSAHGKLVVGR